MNFTAICLHEPLKRRNPMNSRERVIEAINHRQPDRVPLDLGSTINSSIVVEGYERLKQHFAVQTPTKSGAISDPAFSKI